MLTLTPMAAEAVRSLVAGLDLDDETGGLRIAPGEMTGQGPSLELSVVNRPETTDQDVEAGKAHVFDGDSVRFVLTAQGPPAPNQRGRPPV